MFSTIFDFFDFRLCFCKLYDSFSKHFINRWHLRKSWYLFNFFQKQSLFFDRSLIFVRHRFDMNNQIDRLINIRQNETNKSKRTSTRLFSSISIYQWQFSQIFVWFIWIFSHKLMIEFHIMLFLFVANRDEKNFEKKRISKWKNVRNEKFFENVFVFVWHETSCLSISNVTWNTYVWVNSFFFFTNDLIRWIIRILKNEKFLFWHNSSWARKMFVLSNFIDSMWNKTFFYFEFNDLRRYL